MRGGLGPGDSEFAQQVHRQHIVVRGLGMELHDDGAAQRLAQRAGLAARRAARFDDGDPDVLIGPELSPDEQVRVLRAALAATEREAATVRELLGP